MSPKDKAGKQSLMNSSHNVNSDATENRGGSSPYNSEYSLRMAEIELEQKRAELKQLKAEMEAKVEQRRAELKQRKAELEAEREQRRVEAEHEKRISEIKLERWKIEEDLQRFRDEAKIEIAKIEQNQRSWKILNFWERIFLQPAVGKPVESKQVKLNLSVEDPNNAINSVMQPETLMAVHEDPFEDLILPPIHVDLLSQVESKEADEIATINEMQMEETKEVYKEMMYGELKDCDEIATHNEMQLEETKEVNKEMMDSESKDCEETTSVNEMQIKETKEIHNETIHSVEDNVIDGKSPVQKENDFANYDKTSSAETKIIINNQEMSPSEYRSDQRNMEDSTEVDKDSENSLESNISNSRQTLKTVLPTRETLEDCWQYAKKRIRSRKQLVVSKSLTRPAIQKQVKNTRPWKNNTKVDCLSTLKTEQLTSETPEDRWQYAKKWKKKFRSRTQLVVSRNLTRLEIKKQVKNTLVFFEHNREGAKNFTTIAQPLTELTSKKTQNPHRWVRIVHGQVKNSSNADNVSKLFVAEQ